MRNPQHERQDQLYYEAIKDKPEKLRRWIEHSIFELRWKLFKQKHEAKSLKRRYMNEKAAAEEARLPPLTVVPFKMLPPK